MRQVLLIILIYVGARMATAQGIPVGAPSEDCPREKMMMMDQGALPSQTQWTGNFHVVRYDLYMDWRAPLTAMNFGYTGVNRITIVIDSVSQNSITIDAAGCRIDSLRVNGIVVAPHQPTSNETVLVDFIGDTKHVPGDTVVLSITFTHTETALRGFYLYDKGIYVGPSPTGDSVFTADRLAYTMAEPRDAHHWMPCVDDPSMKAKSEIQVLVPAGFQVSSNGILKSANTTASGTLYDWVEDEPIATYLMVANASKFAVWSDTYVRASGHASNLADSVPIMYFTWHIDSTSTDTTGVSYNARHAFRNLPKIMKGYSERFGEYPFSKYGMTPVQPFAYGGMEHQTMTTITRYWLRGTSEMGIAHELTHQWFGDHVTCATWKDIWLNESFATFGEALYSEMMFGPDSYAATVRQQMKDYLTSSSSGIAIYDPEGQGLGVFNWATVYRKGGTVVHMLRRVLGDSLFFNTMRAYQTAFHFRAATTQQFSDFISQYTGQDLRWFIDEWVFGHGHPQYSISGGGHRGGDSRSAHVHVIIKQLDQNMPVFKMPILLRIPSGGGQIDVVVIDSMRIQEFDFTRPPYISIGPVSLDPDNSILKDTTLDGPWSWDTPVEPGIAPQSARILIAVTPNPINDRAILTWSASSDIRGRVDIVDVVGRTVASYTCRPGMGDALEWNAASVAPGIYVARLSTSAGQATTMIHVVH